MTACTSLALARLTTRDLIPERRRAAANRRADERALLAAGRRADAGAGARREPMITALFCQLRFDRSLDTRHVVVVDHAARPGAGANRPGWRYRPATG